LSERIAGRYQDDRQVTQGRLLAARGQELETVHAWHHQVQQDDVRALLRQDF
jgi:hypothetical protein